MQLAPDGDEYAFIEQHTKNIPGWLEDYAAVRTIQLLAWQQEQGIKGPFVEIGVFAGKYLSILVRAAALSDERVIGFDTFQYVSEQGLREHIAAVPGADRVELVSGVTGNLSSWDMMNHIGEKPRFVSIDGSHDCVDVFWDFSLIEQILAPQGVVVADDFLNPLTLGVGEAIHKFFATPRNLAPFAYTSNKLFLCRPAMVDAYRNVFEQCVTDDELEVQSINFRERLTHGRHHVEQSLWGWPVLVP
ncbi:MAG: class I SAM-dependent methyltransferase [Burkholderiales bacterium]|nr:MAG: class I SAM-dependent methyltransferase [Burkholderiales bacterium]